MTGEPYYRDTVAEVDLDAIAHNVGEFRRRLPKKIRLMAAVKANAYGHGAIPVSRAALQAGATDLGVAFLDEALELRRGGVTAPILVLGDVPPNAVEVALEGDIALTVYRFDTAKAISEAAVRMGRKARVHVKVDTGMGRLGLWGETAVPFVEEVASFPGLEVEGLYTHFATADAADKTYTENQHRLLMNVVKELRKRGREIPLVHCSNSAAAIDCPDYAHSMIRLGISMYGYYPSDEVNREAVRLRSALTLKTRVVYLKRPPAGCGISYGKTFIADGSRWVATLPIGYADGFSRSLSNRGEALIRGTRVPIAGRICMDQTMLDVTEAMPVKVGDEVVLYGCQGNESIHVDEVADRLGTISYEVTCMIDRRVPRVYKRSGRTVGWVNALAATSEPAPGAGLDDG
ncbi:alanine racemase [Paludifilum halophilum]|uniref:Alanine racemase n=1 Tax=Paludifilum halophilum TaxID=1642702 RepID=A0A235B3A4_9BACL|nr:alanine racemase [Paludifilum halophilum]OYD06780.1 alanine racemase [Paludifilum halophilum]